MSQANKSPKKKRGISRVTIPIICVLVAITVALNPAARMNPALVEKHYSRKHGPNAYYGQRR